MSGARSRIGWAAGIQVCSADVRDRSLGLGEVGNETHYGTTIHIDHHRPIHAVLGWQPLPCRPVPETSPQTDLMQGGLVQFVLVWSLRFFQKFMNDRALTLASLLAWGMLNTFLPLLLGTLSLIGLVLGDSHLAHAVEQRVFEVLPEPASALVRDNVAAFNMLLAPPA